MLSIVYGEGPRQFGGANVLRKLTGDRFFVILFNRMTVCGLFIGSVLLGAKEFYGDPIDCKVDGVSSDLMDTYCWVTGTYTVKEYFRPEYQKAVAYPGVGHYDETNDDLSLHRQFHRYYQWVPMILALAALRFYVPLAFFKAFVDKGRMNKLLQSSKVTRNSCAR